MVCKEGWREEEEDTDGRTRLLFRCYGRHSENIIKHKNNYKPHYTVTVAVTVTVTVVVLSSVTLPTSAFASLHMVRSLTSKLPSVILFYWI